MKNLPLVSVIICVYNGEEYIDRVIPSALDQSYPSIEIIVVDDGSTDRTAELASNYSEVTLIRNPKNLGLPAARNVGLEVAKGKFIAFLDADDLWVKEKTEKQVQYLQDHDEFRYCYSMERFIYNNERKVPNWTKKKNFQSDHMAYHLGSMLIDADLFKEVGEISTTTGGANDSADWIFRAKDKGFYGGEIKETFLLRGIHGDNISNMVSTQNATLLKALKRSIDRQKGKQ